MPKQQIGCHPGWPDVEAMVRVGGAATVEPSVDWSTDTAGAAGVPVAG